MVVRHEYESAVADGGDPDLVGPDEWNADHVVLGDFLHSVKASADTPDDEFASGTLDAKWTLVAGASGTVDLLSASGSPIYDLATRAGWLLLQPGESNGENVRLRQDYTLPDGSSIVLAMSPAVGLEATPTNNETWFGFGVNDNDTNEESGDDYRLQLDMDASSTTPVTFISYDGTTVLGSVPMHLYGGVYFLRIVRSGLTYKSFFSASGHSWSFLDEKTLSNEATNLWIFARTGATLAIRPIMGVKWIRLGTDDLDPWPWW